MRFNITDNVVVRALNKICDMVCLNILWVICSIPIFTIGASTTALYTIMLKLVKDEEGYIFRDFFRAFRSNFKQSTIIWLLLVVCGFVCWFDYRVAGQMPSTTGFVMKSLFILIGFLLLAVSIYAFALTARYENSIKDTLRNALILTVARLPYTLVMVAVTAVAVVASLWTTVTLMFAIPLWGLIGVALLAWMNSFILRRVFLIFDENAADETKKEEKKE